MNYRYFYDSISAVGNQYTAVCTGANRTQSGGGGPFVCTGFGRATCSNVCYGASGYAGEHNHDPIVSDYFSGSDTFNGAIKQGAPPSSNAAPSTQAAGSQADAFGVLRRAPSSADAIVPQELVRLQADQGTTAQTGEDFASARAATGLATGSAWVVPGNGWTCVYSSPAASGPQAGFDAGSCAPALLAATGRQITVTTTPQWGNSELITGLVPDGVSQVTLHRATSSQTIRVASNVYNAFVPQGVMSVSFDGPAGQLVSINTPS